MSDNRSKDKERPQEASDNENVSEDMNESTSRSASNDYDDWSMERLHSAARERNVKGYMNMDRRGLIHRIFGTGSG